MKIHTITAAEARAEAVARWGEAKVAENEARVRAAFDRPRCDAEAYRGTGRGVCDWKLDHGGACPNAGRHV